MSLGWLRTIAADGDDSSLGAFEGEGASGFLMALACDLGSTARANARARSSLAGWVAFTS
jgi:hypothetical protein